MTSILIKGGTLVTMDTKNSIVQGDLLIDDGRIASMGATAKIADVTIDATDCAVLPGFVQTHVHLCQTLFRGAADDLSLIDWLKERVWPMEAAHTAESIRASARLGIAELIKGGTTCALTMETVSHTGEVFRVVEETGFRGVMDLLVACGVIAAWLLTVFVIKTWLRLGAFLLLVAGYLFLVKLAYDHASMVIPGIPPVLAFALTGLVSFVYDFTHETLENSASGAPSKPMSRKTSCARCSITRRLISASWAVSANTSR